MTAAAGQQETVPPDLPQPSPPAVNPFIRIKASLPGRNAREADEQLVRRIEHTLAGRTGISFDSAASPGRAIVLRCAGQF